MEIKKKFKPDGDTTSGGDRRQDISMNQNMENDQKQGFPNGFLQLFLISDIKNPIDGLTVLLHSILLEVGFLPKDVDRSDVLKCMPQQWNSSGFSKIQYCHKSVSDEYCWVTFVPMYNKIVIHGSLENELLQDTNINVSLNIDSYVNKKKNILDPSTLFINTNELVITFKDEICFPLLVQIQDGAGITPRFGFNGLLDEVKVFILRLLDVKSVISLSAVNKDFNIEANSPLLWKHLFTRDYTKATDSTPSGSEEDWKKMYKKEYRYRARTFQQVRHNNIEELIEGMDPNPWPLFPDFQHQFTQLFFDDYFNLASNRN